MLLPHIEKIVRSIDADARLRGAELWFADPGKGKDPKRDSASINVRTGKWHARASGKSGGDVISLVAYLRGTNQAEAAIFAAEAAGLDLPRTAGRSYHRATSNGANAGNWSNGHWHAPGAAGTAPSSAQHEDSKERAARLWAQGQAFKGTVGPAYLQSRGIDPSVVLDDELRIIPDLAYFTAPPPTAARARSAATPPYWRRSATDSQASCPASCGYGSARTAAAKRKSSTLKRARAQTPKKLAGKLESGGIWFGPPGETLLMCEGLEDALSLRQATGLPVVATSGWQQMGKTALPPIVKRLIVVPDDNSDPDDPSKQNVGERGLEQAARIYGALGH